MQKSEFGKGLTYCLGLFLCHSERDYVVRDGFAKTKEDKECLEIITRPAMWFYGAADHLFGLQIPETLSESLQKRLRKFRAKVLSQRLPMDPKDNATEKDKAWAIQEAKDLLRLIDKFHGVKTQKGSWQ